MPTKKTIPKPASPSVAIPENEQPDRSALQALYRAEWDREMQRCKESFDHAGSLPALVDALICCHESKDPLPDWVAVNAISVITAFFTGRKILIHGKPFRRGGRIVGNPVTRHRQSLIELIRWEYVTNLKDREKEMREIITYRPQEKKFRPRFFKLVQGRGFNLDQRYDAVVELLALLNSPAQCEFKQMKKSYKKVQKAMLSGKTGEYHIPGPKNPLRRFYDPEFRAAKPVAAKTRTTKPLVV